LGIGLTTSLFADKPRVDGCEVKFRVVCGLGWQLHKRLAELRVISQKLPELWFYYINQIEEIVVQGYKASHREASTWPADIENALLQMTNRPEFRPLIPLCSFLQNLPAEIPKPDSLDPASHFDFFNKMGFRLANQMICDPVWSTALAAGRWDIKQPKPIRFLPDTQGNFQPVTPEDKTEIQVQVNTADFDCRNSLLYFLTLEYQMMHEYISHFLPAWNSGNALEHEYLQAIMFLYCRAKRQPRDGIHIFLVGKADEQRADAYRTRRKIIQDELAPALGESILSRHLMSLAVANEQEMSADQKRHLLALMNRLPAADATLEAAIESWFATFPRNVGNNEIVEDLSTIYQRLATAFSDDPSLDPLK
jgi:hypothetical protein